MIFERIGHIATRYRIPIIIAWIAAAMLMTLVAPNIEEVSSSDQADFLPDNAPFAHAQRVYRETFPNSFAPGSTVIVVDARTAQQGILKPDASLAFADRTDTPAAHFIVEMAGWLNYGAVLNSTQALQSWRAAVDGPYDLAALRTWRNAHDDTEALSNWLTSTDRAMLVRIVQEWLNSDAASGSTQALQAWAAAPEDIAVLEAWFNSDAAAENIAGLSAWLEAKDVTDIVLRVTTPTASPATAALMIAGDKAQDPAYANQVAIVRVQLSTSNPEEATSEGLNHIDAWLAEHRPANIQTYQTGEAPVVNNTTESIKTSVDRTIWVTVVLVITMLLAVYRSPVSPLIPLAAVTLAYLITRGIVAFMGAHVMTITSYANVLLVVVMYGAGTDYCLFLISRFREEMADDLDIETATAHTVHRVGETITSSAGTIFVGFMAMMFAEMGVFNTTGPALAIGIVFSLAAGLTLVPALLSTLGERAFWPGEATHRSTGRWYALTSKQVSSYPLVTILVIVVLMAPLSVYALDQDVTYDLLADLPDDKDSVVGYEIMEQSLGAGNVMPLAVVITGRDPDRAAVEIVTLTEQLTALEGVAEVRGLNTPLGQDSDMAAGLLRVDRQLALALDLFAGDSPQQMPTSLDPQALLDGVRSYFDLIEQRFFPDRPPPADLAALQDILAETDNLLALYSQRDALQTHIQGLADYFASEVDDPYLLPTALSDMLGSLPGGDLFAQLLPTYLAQADNGIAYKLDVITANRSSTEASMRTVHNIRAILDGYDDQGEAVVSGGAAINTDISDTMDRDFFRAVGFVLLGIFIVLMLMLRSLIAPVYLIGTVLLSYTFTLGLTNIVFKHVFFDADGLTWYVPFFIFVFLVALGIDYSIFLFGRIKEEVGYHGIREGVHVAVARTGAIITSAGMILSGTFAAMLAGEIMGLLEVGFAVAVGVLIDTFVVRTILDPALAALFGRWTWWPGGTPQAQDRRPDKTPAPAPQPGD